MHLQYTTPNPIDNIVYGELLIDDKTKITCSDRIIAYFFTTGLNNKFFKLKPPANSSQETINELLFLERVTANATEKQILFATNAEINEKKCYSDFAKKYLGIKFTTKDVEKIFNQTDPILMLLKNHFNRARPYQLAPYYNVQIEFNVPTECFHPAYPSGHAMDSFIMSHVFKTIKPEKSFEIDEFCNEMAYSRFVAGVHYPSDNKISKLLADTIISHNLLKF